MIYTFLVAIMIFPVMNAKESTENSFVQFYQTPNGEMIMNAATFPKEIHAFLQEENRFVLSRLLTNQYDYLYEVGCGPSHRAIDVVRFGKQFYGIDVNANYVSQSNKLFSEEHLGNNAHADLFSVLFLTPATYSLPKDKKALIFFPFNIIGNLDDFHLVLSNIIDIEQDFCFSSYKINDLAKNSRKAYYTNCKCEKLRYSRTPIGDLFDSRDGLHSAAFKVSYMVELLEDLLASKGKKATIEIVDLNMAFMVYVHNFTDVHAETN